KSEPAGFRISCFGFRASDFVLRISCLVLSGCVLAGCRNNNNELVESELRAQERIVREQREELARLQAHNDALQRDLGTTQQGTAYKLPPELAAQTCALKRIALGRGTCGYDTDGQLGDEAVQVILEPRDGADHTIKAPGTVTVSALEITAEGIKTPNSTW